MQETIQLKLLAVIDDVISLTSDDFGKTENFCLYQYTKFKHYNIPIQKRHIYPICAAARPGVNESQGQFWVACRICVGPWTPSFNCNTNQLL